MNKLANKVFTVHTDPGHGWLAVNEKDVEAVGLSVKDFTQFSYRNGKTLYLEEDCDYPTFWRAFKNTFGVEFNRDVKYYDKRHWIRSYERLS